jgi:hypothetical protein
MRLSKYELLFSIIRNFYHQITLWLQLIKVQESFY